MAPPNEKLASALEALQAVRKDGRPILRSADLTRTHRQRLETAGFLKPVIKGWYMAASPSEMQGETTAWCMSIRSFVQTYCESRFGEGWYCNAELSILLHTGTTTLPAQILVNAGKGTNNHLQLPAATSLFDYKVKDLAPPDQRTVVQGLRVLTLEAALVRVAPNFWRADSQTMQVALAQFRDAAQLNRLLLDGGHSAVAGRLAGAFAAVGKGVLAEEITTTMKAAGYVVVVNNPFDEPVPPSRPTPESPYCSRIRAMWAEMRTQVLEAWTEPVRKLPDVVAYLKEAEARYLADAYHSLSIEGYQVNADLIEKVRKGGWSPDTSEKDKNDHNVLAARGYFEAHLRVRESIEAVLNNENAGNVLRKDLPRWNQALWSSSVQAGIMKPSELAGWRGHPVYIRNSMHTPLPHEALRDVMPTFFELLAEEPEPAVQAVLGHFVFVFIHPYMDGNGRLGRFILNLMLARGGWLWTVVSLESRKAYMEALEDASARKNIVPFTKIINDAVHQQLKNGLSRPI